MDDPRPFDAPHAAPISRRWRLVGVATVLAGCASVFGVWWLVSGVAPPVLSDPSAWDDGRIRFSYPNNWRVQIDAIPSDQISQVSLLDAAEIGVLSIRTYTPAQLSTAEVELEAVVFEVAEDRRRMLRAETSVTQGPRGEAIHKILGVRSAAASATVHSSLLGVEIEQAGVRAWEVRDERLDRSATIWEVRLRGVDELDQPGIALILDTLAWVESPG